MKLGSMSTGYVLVILTIQNLRPIAIYTFVHTVLVLINRNCLCVCVCVCVCVCMCVRVRARARYSKIYREHALII